MNEDEAALQYDWKSIMIFGLKAKTNFSYTKSQVLRILAEEHLFTFQDTFN